MKERLNKGFNKVADFTSTARLLVDFVSSPLYEEVKTSELDDNSNLVGKVVVSFVYGLLKLAAQGTQVGIKGIEVASEFGAIQTGGRVTKPKYYG